MLLHHERLCLRTYGKGGILLDLAGLEGLLLVLVLALLLTLELVGNAALVL